MKSVLKNGMKLLLLLLLTGILGSGQIHPASAEIEEMIERHNHWRNKLGLPALVWSDALANFAQEWANKLAANGCKMKHRQKSSYGENIYWTSDSSTPTKVVDAWASEEKYFSHKTQKCKKEWYMCGHYTQLIWEKTKKVGCAVASCGDKGEIWVCNYDPPGNYTGEKAYTPKKQ